MKPKWLLCSMRDRIKQRVKIIIVFLGKPSENLISLVIDDWKVEKKSNLYKLWKVHWLRSEW